MSKEIVEQLRKAVPGYLPGWGGPEFTGWQDEQMSWKTSCYIGDWSFLMDVAVEGPDALRFFRDTCINSFEKFDIGQAKHIVQCSADGKVITEGVLLRLGEHEFSAQSNPAMYSHFLLSKGNYAAQARRQATFQYQVSGPSALAVCEKAAGQSLSDIGFMRFRPITIAGKKVLPVRQGMAGEIGFELHGAREDGPAVYQAILEAGAAFGIRRLGMRTAMINHLEAAFPTGFWHYFGDWFSTQGFLQFVLENYSFKTLQTEEGSPFYSSVVPALRGSFEGEQINDFYRSPVELGWGKSIKFDHDFPGRAALQQELAQPQRLRVTLEYNNDDMVDIYASLFREGTPYDFMDVPHQAKWVTWADQVLKEGKPVGVSTVPGYSFYFRKVLALAYLAPQYCQPGTTVEVVWGNPGTPQKKVRAIVKPAPYKTDNRRGPLG
jgi:vanillate/3-O-methylgallate O-demethylase